MSDSNIQRIDADQLRGLLADPKQVVVVVDVRSAKRYEQGHVPGAVNIPLPDLVADDPRLAEATALVVYGDSWRDDLSAAAAKRLLSLRYRNVMDYRGGLEDWGGQGAER